MEAEDMLENAAAKDNQYSAVADFLRRHCRGYQISHQSYIMSVYGIIDQPSWEKHLVQDLSLTEAQTNQIQIQAFRECIAAGHALHNTYRHLIEGLRAQGFDTTNYG
eukprot:1791747-Rhodomonas_salina.1